MLPHIKFLSHKMYAKLGGVWLAGEGGVTPYILSVYTH
jgi:hypothetical protein